ncbi:cytochrome C oxidase subunit IV family protein [Verrucomicrobiaceae bacterium 227]
MNLHFIFPVLLILTGATAWASGHATQSHFTLLGLAGIKLLLVAFFFMDLKEAHLFWKGLIVMFFIAFLGTNFLIHAS